MFLRLASKDETLTAILRRFSSASALAGLNSGNAKTVYTNKAEDALKSMRKWLRDQQTTAFNVTYRGKTRKRLLDDAANRSRRSVSALTASDPLLFPFS